MTDVTGQVARLSPERQALLQKILREKALAGGSADEIRARPGGGPAPLSFAQRGLWFIHQMDPSGATYHIPYALRLRGPLHADALCRALAEVVRRHESLRTVFRAGDGGEPMQHVLPAECFAVERVDLSDLSHEEAEARLRELADAEAVRPFDLAGEPAFRVILARRSDNEHGLFVTLHHVVTDQWSGELLLRETAEGYGALLRGEPIRLPPLPLQYGDYAAWQRQRLGGEVLDRQLAWWKRQLEGIPAVQEIPLDRPRPPVAGSVAGHAAIELSARTSARLRALSHETGATLFATLLAGFQLLLGRWSGSDDVVVGTPVGGRPRVETESIIGYFVNTLAVRARLGGDPTFRTFLLRVRDAVIDAQAHQDVPFDRIVEELTPERSLAYTPIYQTSFSFTPAGTPVTRLGNVELEPLEQRPPAAKFDLGLAMDADESGILRGSFLFRTALFDPETAERLLASLAALLDAASAAPDTPISRLPLLSAEGRREVLERWNGTASGYPRAATAASEFARQAAATPAATALSIGGETMTYAALEARANRIARVLRARGVRHETRVGVSLERSLDLPVVLLAILKAGGAYVPLDPSYPADRLAFMRQDAGVELVVARRAHAAWPSLAGAELLVLEDAEDEIASASPDAVDGGATADSLAYVIYTSGSTGTPKGVAVPHRGILRLVRGNGFASMTPDETFLQLAPVAFDASTLELWGPLLNGGRLAIHPPTEPTLESIERAIRGEGVTTLWLTAGLFHLAVDERPGMFTGVRQLLAGGDVLSPAHVARVRRAHPELRLINGYGPTESTTFTACHTVRDGDENGAIPLGSPIADTRVYVAGREMSPVPVGAAGELLIGGDGLARGYLNRPALTAEKFIPDPFSPVPGGRLYRTGDRARWRHDGTLEFLGRLDFQVKIRGFRIEPGEIEAVLRAHPAVGEAVVVVRNDGPGGRRLVAYAASPSTSADELRAHLHGRLPEHMVPAEVVVLPALPLNANGKVDRRALPDPAGLEGEAGDGFVAPRTLTEELMAGIWADVLELDRVSADADFFELGGHSLLATTAVSRVRNAFGVELRLRMLFEAPTPAGLAARVDALRAQGAAAPPPMLPAPRDAALPLSFAQQRLWFLDQVQPGTAQYNVPLAVRTRARLDAGALERALAEVVRRHETLRTAFATVDGEPVQVIGPAAFRLERVDLSPLGAAEREATARRLAAEEAARPFDLARGPVIRGTLLRLAENDHVLLLTLHHVASDAWSLGVLEREVSALYAAYAAGGESPLEELALQYADFAAWQRAWLSGPVLDAQLEYWRGKLAGVAPLLELPLDRPRPPAQGTEGGVVPLALPAELADRLRALGRREGTTLYMTLLAAFQVVLGRFCGTDDVPVGGPIAGRTRVETEGLIGFFVNTLVLRGDLSGDPTFRALLARVRETVLDAHAHQDLPFEKLVEELGVERATTHAPLVQAAFQLLTSAPGAPAGDALRWEAVESAQPNAKFDLLLGVHDEQRALEGSLVYRAELFDEATARRMVDALVHLLHAAVADPDTPV
ncbi:MAG TPA: amino acid adenylation domain-containing protein, partial [Longimicrobium sp.]|nr:amino acid adenylation domain-containing protein [Longimicrobium sp.]